METIQKCKKAKIRCSVIGLSAEIFISEMKRLGILILWHWFHFKELLLEHAPLPPAIAEYAAANLIEMGFPQRGAEGVIAICSCHKDVKIGGGYTCPRCKARVCELPTECWICGLTLVSSPYLARSYHHLFPVTPFNEVSSIVPFKLRRIKSAPHVSCPKCNQHSASTVIFISTRVCTIVQVVRVDVTQLHNNYRLLLQNTLLVCIQQFMPC
ncbi:unnamed protein product [Musa acuminata var. zebrina]